MSARANRCGARPRLVVVGNGMAGARVLEELHAAAPERYRVTVLGAEPHPNYSRILLSPVLAGELTLPDIVLNDEAWYRDRGMALRLDTPAASIDRVRREVVAADGSREPYDRLVLATGSSPVVLPVPGADLAGVLTYRDIRDTRALIEAARRFRRAVVIGGGLLGLEAANGLVSRGMEVTVVHLMDWLMERQLDRTAGEMLQATLERRGIRFLLSARTERLLGGGDGRVRAVELAHGARMEADLVVMAVGIRPSTALAEAAGLLCKRGVVVSDTMQTSDPRIYAVGECVAHRGVAYGLVAPLYEMARVCADHLAERGVTQFRRQVPATHLKVTGIEVFSAGELEAGNGAEEIVLADPVGQVYKKLVIRDGRLVGGVLYGDVSDSGRYLALLQDRTPVAPLRDTLMFPELGG